MTYQCMTVRLRSCSGTLIVMQQHVGKGSIANHASTWAMMSLAYQDREPQLPQQQWDPALHWPGTAGSCLHQTAIGPSVIIMAM